MSDMTLPAEDHEMTSIRQVFDRVLNTVADATRLAKDVETLKVSVSELQASVDGYRRKISEQDQQISLLREQRDAATTENWQIKSDNANLKTRNAELEARQSDSQKVISDLQDTVARLRRESDDHGLAAIEAGDRASKAEAKLNEIKAALGLTEASNVVPLKAEEVTKEPEVPFTSEAQSPITTQETPLDVGQKTEEASTEYSWPHNITR